MLAPRVRVCFALALLALTLVFSASGNHGPSVRMIVQADDTTEACSLISSCTDCTALSLESCAWCSISETCFNATFAPRACAVGCSALVCDAADPCPALGSCGECVANSACGWCSSVQKCSRGGPAGDCAGLCDASAWSFSNCTANCAFAPTCANCTLLGGDGCVWCADADVCAGSAALCPAPNCAWDSCALCQGATSCAECVTSLQCGWCESTGSCEPAASWSSPCTAGACPDSAASWRVGTCAANCSQWSGSCATCLGSGDSSCRFCESSGACVGPGDFASCASVGCLAAACPECASYATCLDCTADAGCGWCASSQSCVAGTATGACASDAQCDVSAWSYGSCEADCESFSGAGCAACLGSGSDCAWCASAAVCESASELSSNASTCTCAFAQSCPAVDCGALSGTNCSVCLGASPLCGWCAATSTCSLGTEMGPCAHGLVCTSEWAFGTCDAVCGTHSACGACRGETTASCGWCAGTSEGANSANPTSLCVAADASGDGAADGRSCTRWYPPGVASKPLCADCEAQYDTCGACVADPLCGWCDQQRCTEGTAAGPFIATDPLCTGWSYGNCDAQCLLHADCAACASARGCGWCENPAHVQGYCVATAFESECYAFYESSCATSCANFVNCGACTANSSCGWCGVSSSSSLVVGECVEGNGVGPAGSVTCPEGYSYGPETCELKCVMYPDCGGCLSGHTGCGYCLVDGGECMPGSYDGPSLGTCPPTLWVYEPNHCPVNPCPSRNASCDSCIAADSCGWCASDSQCYPGFKSAPLPPYFCAATAWSYAVCPQGALTTGSPGAHKSPSSGPSPYMVAGITVGVMLVPIAIAVAFAYKHFVLKHRYPPLE